MKINFFGHACFGIEGAGLRVLLDPFQPGAFDGRFRYPPVPGRWDAVVISHEHLDHNFVAPWFGAPVVFRGPGELGGLEVRTFIGRHGDAAGTMDQQVRINRLSLDGVSLVHPGDLAGPPDETLTASLRPVDVLFLPVGGHFTMGPEAALETLRRLQPKVALPMHYKTPLADLQIGPLSAFLRICDYPVMKKLDPFVELTADDLPSRTEVWTPASPT